MKKRVISFAAMIILACSICIAAAAEQVTDSKMITPDSGLCGENMKWVLDESGTLTISGAGDMYSYVDFDNNSVTIPWFEKNNAALIKRAVVEDGVESISDMAFYGTSITSLKLPDSVKSIGVSSVANCQELTTVILPENIKEIPESAFNCDSNLKTISLPVNLESICESAFIHCRKLKDIVIPATVTEIKDYAFFDCPSIEKIVIPDKMTIIRHGAFEACSGLKSVAFPPSLEVIEQSAFSACANIEEIVLPDGLTEIGQNAFSYSREDRNSGLPKQKVYTPQSIKKIDRNGIDSDSEICGFKNSIAEQYSVENEIEFVAVADSLYDTDKYNDEKERYYANPLPVSTLTVHSGKAITVSVDNRMVDFPDAQPFIDENGRTQIPIRAVADLLDCTVDWRGENKTVIITNTNGDTVVLAIGSDIMIMNDTPLQMDTAAMIKDERTYIPVRFVAEAMGLTVEWTK